MVDLSDFSAEDLRAELERRGEPEAKLEISPTMLDAQRYAAFVASVDRMIQDDIKRGGMDDDTPHYVYEEAMVLVYGDKAFDTLNKIFR